MTAEASARWERFLKHATHQARNVAPLEVSGTLVRLTGLVLEASGLNTRIGAHCHVRMQGHAPVLAEVVGFAGERTFLMPAGDMHGLAGGAQVIPIEPAVMPLHWDSAKSQTHRGKGIDTQQPEAGELALPVGSGLLGRVVDALGEPMDRQGKLVNVELQPLNRTPINAMDRMPVREPLDTGVRAINALFTVGRGQRIGLFSGSGVGKSVLMGMMARYTEADVIVVGLIGERGREVKEFIEDILGQTGRSRSVVVAAPADAPPMLRMQGAMYATAIAENFRDQGQHVLLLMDSLTRYAMAQREIALAMGEPPATKGYPPSCFAKLPQLVERSGNGTNGVGSITAFYTVLSEGDDQQDPIADAARAVLDGHIVLSRALAEAGHFPAIDVEQSSSRVMHSVVTKAHFAAARRFRAIQSRYERARDLIQVGAYVKGSDPGLDEAIKLHQLMEHFLQQDMFDAAQMDDSLGDMMALLDSTASAADSAKAEVSGTMQ